MQESEPGILDRNPTLKDILDLESFTDLCSSFCSLFGIGLKVFDLESNPLVDIRIGNSEFCSYICDTPQGHKKCRKTGKETVLYHLQSNLPVEITSIECFTGLHYMIMPVIHDMDYMGRIVLGPYRTQNNPDLKDDLECLGQGFSHKEASLFFSNIRCLPDETVKKLLKHLQQVMDVVIHSNYRAHLAGLMHYESIGEIHQELIEKNSLLEENLKKLREVDRLKSNFLATVSHELRTPLTSVIGYSDMLLSGLAGDLSEEQKEFITTILRKGESLLEIITSLIDISRIESGKVSLSPSIIDIPGLIESAVGTINPHALNKKQILTTYVEDNLPAIYGDLQKISQCIINLLSNAVKFSPEGGKIKLRAETYTGKRRKPPPDKINDSGYRIFGDTPLRFLCISISDSGKGIPEDKKEKIFDSFYQIDGSCNRTHGGTGLGLSIVKSYTEAHNGEVWVDSLPEGGSVFSLLLPESENVNLEKRKNPKEELKQTI